MCPHLEGPTMNDEQLKDTLIHATRDFWAAYSNPLLLSNLPSSLSEKGIADYKSILGNTSLKAFVSTLAEQGHLKVVTHPQHRAKIGLIPAEESYDFPQEEDAVKQKQKYTGDSHAVRLLDILSKLDDQDLVNLNIPVSVLAKLHRLP
ncbi:hypothetical protein PsaNZ63_00965 [Pseudomonas syringae pv. actinidiae]|nr:hypothetical protein PsaNZ45_25220 [Pseudomonas syringae pv. actinidiae]OKS63268.1 hypothetical protein PsaNZ63_00965 [Pseudomonas syringae pv. actinidiae]